MNTIPEGFRDNGDFQNTLSGDFKGEQRRKTNFKTREERRAHDAKGLVAMMRKIEMAEDKKFWGVRDFLPIIENIVHVHRDDFSRALLAAICRAEYGARQQTPSPFTNLDGKNNLEKREILKRGFEASLVPWEEAGLFSFRRRFIGSMGCNYHKPDFTDYAPLFDTEDFDMMEGDGIERLDRGYGRLVCSPADVPVESDIPNDLTYVNVLKKALIQAFRGRAGGKEPNTLLIGAEKKVITADEINFEEPVRVDPGLFEGEMVYNPTRFNRCDRHELGGQSEAEMMRSLQGIERKTGCVVRLERDRPVSNCDVGRINIDSGRFHAIMQQGEVFPDRVSAQDIKQALAYYIHCLTTEGWIPDSRHNDIGSGKTIDNSTIVVTGTCIANDTQYGASAPELYWNAYTKSFNLYANPLVAGGQGSLDECIRVGIRKNDVH